MIITVCRTLPAKRAEHAIWKLYQATELRRAQEQEQQLTQATDAETQQPTTLRNRAIPQREITETTECIRDRHNRPEQQACKHSHRTGQQVRKRKTAAEVRKYIRAPQQQAGKTTTSRQQRAAQRAAAALQVQAFLQAQRGLFLQAQAAVQTLRARYLHRAIQQAKVRAAVRHRILGAAVRLQTAIIRRQVRHHVRAAVIRHRVRLRLHLAQAEVRQAAVHRLAAEAEDAKSYNYENM